MRIMAIPGLMIEMLMRAFDRIIPDDIKHEIKEEFRTFSNITLFSYGF